MKIIVNADDFGMSLGINRAIVYLMNHHKISSTTIMMNMEYVEDAIELYSNNQMNVGVHLNITKGKSLLAHQYITKEDGTFIKNTDYSKLELTDLVLKEIEEEWEAQIQKAITSGIQVTHIDCHHHMYMKDPKMAEISFKLARKYHLPLRVNENMMTCPDDICHVDHFVSGFDAMCAKHEDVRELLKEEYPVIEIMVHPAFVDNYLLKNSSMNLVRLDTFDILNSDLLDRYELISYKDI